MKLGFSRLWNTLFFWVSYGCFWQDFPLHVVALCLLVPHCFLSVDDLYIRFIHLLEFRISQVNIHRQISSLHSVSVDISTWVSYSQGLVISCCPPKALCGFSLKSTATFCVTSDIIQHSLITHEISAYLFSVS